MFLIAFYIGGLYENDRLQRPGRMLAAAFISVTLGAVLVTSVFYATLTEERVGRGIFVGFAAIIRDSRRKLQFDVCYIKHMSLFLNV